MTVQRTNESTPKKKESTPEKKETSQVVVHKIPNQSNSPPSLSFLFKSASMKDESNRVLNQRQAKSEQQKSKIVSQNKTALLRVFLFSSTVRILHVLAL